ncbi:monothiol glutaredoxin [Basidiobolus meristosporus CBS 931.73]|uniref:Monothiol glutaredoxin-5, mitochondrial n=1 Tax=Basidiobolus meristosporus CBS 931.73 TaxID=1314790 RepID=A0A1Y1XZF8_9FUNG|nr:monothiol glutaredoxin [Basidiobolus meristosporus CBS 931.73]|eukprot:ORX91119.1 monothiol glutaredoxin [Basidiobolus meristosporus CBS 931.73]
MFSKLAPRLFLSSSSLLASSGRIAIAPRVACSVRFLSDELRHKLDKTIKENDVCLFMKGTPEEPMCGFSKAVSSILNLYDIKDLKAYNVFEDPELRNGIKEYSNWPTIPQVYVKGEFVGGCDIVLNMHQSGQLEELLIKEDVLKHKENADSPTQTTETA